MIKSVFPWILFIHCISHEMSLIIKDCFKENGGIEELHKLNSWMSDAQYWFSSHACSAFIKQLASIDEPTAFIWPSVIRYCGNLLKIKRFRDMKELLRRVVSSGVYHEKIFKDDAFAC